MLFLILLLVGVSGSCIVLPTEIRIFAYKQDCIRHGYPNQLTCPDSWKLHQELKQAIPNYPNQVLCESTKICCMLGFIFENIHNYTHHFRSIFITIDF